MQIAPTKICTAADCSFKPFKDFNHFHEYTVAMEQVGPNGKNLKRWNILEKNSSNIVKSHVISGCGCARWCKKAPVMEEPHNPQFIQARSALSWPHTHNFYMKTWRSTITLNLFMHILKFGQNSEIWQKF